MVSLNRKVVYGLLAALLVMGIIVIRVQPEKLSPPLVEQIDYNDIKDDKDRIPMDIEYLSISKPEEYYLSNVIGKILYTQGIRINGKVFYFYPQFDSMDNAVASIKTNCRTVIQDMRIQSFILCDFTDKTWPNYCNRINGFSESVEKAYENKRIGKKEYEKLNEQISDLNTFFDIAGNAEQNQQLEELVRTMIDYSGEDKDGNKTISKKGIEMLLVLMPDGFADDPIVNGVIKQ